MRLSQELYDDLNEWAKDDFRSLNGQIEYLLTACVRSRKKSGRYIPVTLDLQEDAPQKPDADEE